jgi:hypothetical protein
MAQSAKKGYLKVADQNLTEHLNSITFDTSSDTIDITKFKPNGTDNSKEYIEGLSDGTFSASGDWTKDLQDKIASIKTEIGTEGNAAFEYRPLNKAGAVEFTGNCLLTGVSISGEVSGKIEITLNFQITGAVEVDAIPSE